MKKIMFNDALGLTEAVLEGRKTMTRRFVPKGYDLTLTQSNLDFIRYYSNYQIGDTLAVAQKYRDIKEYNPDSYEDVMLSDGVICGASHPYSNLMNSAGWGNKMFVRPTLMPNRIRIISIKVERLQDISDEDCLKEGIIEYAPCCECGSELYAFDGADDVWHTPREAFAALIDKISGKGTWDKNPWVFVYEFKLVK